MQPFAIFSTVSFHSTGMALGSYNKRHGIWTKSRPTDCGGYSSTMKTMERNSADCFKSGDWVYMTPNDPQWRRISRSVGTIRLGLI